MVDVFADRTLIQNNRDRDELDTEQQVVRKLRNKVLLLYFGSGSCPKCQCFSLLLKDFTTRLLDEYYVERAAQLALLYVSQDQTEEQERKFLKTMPWRWLTLPFTDSFKSYKIPSLHFIVYRVKRFDTDSRKARYQMEGLLLLYSVRLSQTVSSIP
uniref:Nucleoredoxin like 1 n=1 Tax=Callorhinchus milii TaxID=7868 RepID=A0A4W3GSF7_CALMI